MNGRLRILLVEPALGDNGALRSSLERASRWSADCEVVLLVVDRQRNEVDPPPGIPTVVANEKGLRRRLLEGKPVQRCLGRRTSAIVLDRALAGLSELMRLIMGVARGYALARRADVVVAGREIESGLLVGAIASKLARRPFAVTGRSNFEQALRHHVPRRYHRITRWATARADVVVCVSRGVIDTYRRSGLPRRIFHVVLNGLDAEEIRSRSVEVPSMWIGHVRYLVAVGRLGHAKGFDLLIRAHAGALAAGAPPHELWIVGEGPLRNDLAELAADLGIGDSVRLLGFLDNPHAVVTRSEGLVLSSRWEGLSRVLIEALILGVPCIATDCVAGPSEVLEGGKWGRLVAPGDVDELAAVMSAHLRNPADLRRRAQLGKDRAAARFDVDLAARRHLAILRSIAGMSTCGGGSKSSTRSGLGSGPNDMSNDGQAAAKTNGDLDGPAATGCAEVPPSSAAAL